MFEQDIQKFKEDLRRARHIYNEDYRSGTVFALQAVIGLVEVIFRGERGGEHLPFVEVMNALHDAERGLVPPFFRPSAGTKGKNSLSRSEAIIRCLASAGIDVHEYLSNKQGRSRIQSRKSAAVQIASILIKNGYKIRGKSDVKHYEAILNWRKNLRDGKYDGLATETYEEGVQKLHEQLIRYPSWRSREQALWPLLERLIQNRLLHVEDNSPQSN